MTQIPRIRQEELLAVQTLVGNGAFHPAIFLAVSKKATLFHRKEQPTMGRKWVILNREN
jgi:hypothetical protein